ncbi:MAG: XRE family transcriptional regulator [Thermodesulfobacteriota bacterium]|nr:XRE family transcriptional regulator [Thermodesulfobacteriota bacterium]
MEYTDICQKIKELRKKKRLTIKELGARAQITQGYLSRIENSRKPPPIPTLLKIAEALNVHISCFFGDGIRQNGISIIRKNERKEIIRNFSSLGYIYETVAYKKSDKVMEPLILTLPKKLNHEKIPFMTHDGEEFLYVLKGEMIFFYGDDKYHVKEGDCLYLDPTVPHKGICATKNGEVKLLVVLSPYTRKLRDTL